MLSSAAPGPWEPPIAAAGGGIVRQERSTVQIVRANPVDCPDFIISMDILGEPKAQESYHLAIGRNGRPYLYDPSARDKTRLHNTLRTAIMAHLGFTEDTDFPLFKEPDNDELKLAVTVKYHISVNKDIENMCKFLFDAMQHVVYNNDKSVWELQTQKLLVNEAEAKTEIYMTISAL